MRFSGPRTFRRRIELLLAIALAPAFILALANAYSTRNVERREVQQQAYRLASTALTTQAQLIESADRLFTAFPRVAALRPGPTDDCLGLAAAAGTLETFDNVGIVAPDGRVTCAIRPVAAGTNVSWAEWFQKARETPLLVVGGFEEGPLSSSPTLVLARRMQAGDEEVILFAALDLGRVSALLQAIPLPPESSITMIDDAGRIIARHPDHERWVGRGAARIVLADSLARQDGVTEAPGVDGIPRLYGFRRLTVASDASLLLTAGVPTDIAYASADRHLRLNLLVLTVVAVAAYVLARRLSVELFGRKIDSVLRAARGLSEGNLGARTNEPWTDDEVGELAKAFDAMAWTLAERTRRLHGTVESLRALVWRLMAAREEEHARVAHEIDGDLGRAVEAIRADLERLEASLADAAIPSDVAEALRDTVTLTRDRVDAALAQGRRVSDSLRPGVAACGVPAAVGRELDAFTARTGLRTTLVVEPHLPDVDEAQGVAVLRILQEALRNVAQHAGATELTVRLSAEFGAIVCEVTDDGRGFDTSAPPASPHSLGLLAMEERAASLGGELDVSSSPGRGTVLLATIPVPGFEEP